MEYETPTAMAPRTRAPKTTRPRAGTVALVGRSNVGKSTLLNALLDHPLAIVSPVVQTTRHRILGVLRHGDDELRFLDTPGFHAPRSRLGKVMNETARGAAEEADVLVFVCDAASAHEKQATMGVHPGDAVLLSDVGKDKPTVLAVNKIDRVRPKDRLFPLLEAYASIREFAAIVPIAALRRDGLGALVAEITRLLPEGEPAFGEDDLTDRPTRFFVEELVRAEVLRLATDEVPHATTVTVDRYDTSTAIPRIDATIHVERAGQKAILVGKGGAAVKRIGTGARRKIEELVGGRVHLALFVRVTEGWTDDPRRLADLGLDGRRDDP